MAMIRKAYIILTTLLFLLIMLPTEASAQRRSSEVEAQRKRTEELKRDLDKSKKRVETLKREKSSASKRVSELNQQINLRSSLISETEYERDLVASDIEALEMTIDSLEIEFELCRENYREMVRHAYRLQERNSYTTYLLSSSSYSDFTRRMNDVESFAEQYKEVANIARIKHEELSLARYSLDVRLLELDSISQSLDAERQELRGGKAEAQSVYDKLTKQEKDALKEQQRQQELYKEADERLKRILAENTVGSNFSSNTRGLKLPIEGGKIRPLQPNMAEISGRRGSAVRCVEAGTVGEITRSRGDHYIVKIAHGKDFFTVYTHVSKVCVNVGQKVKANQQIGTAGVFVDYDGSERSFIQFMVHNHRTGEMESVMKFFSKK